MAERAHEYYTLHLPIFSPDTMVDGEWLRDSRFPIFIPMKTTVEMGGEDLIMCLFKENGMFCTCLCDDFYDFLVHLKLHHKLALETNNDCCYDCSIIFNNEDESKKHFLEHHDEYE